MCAKTAGVSYVLSVLGVIPINARTVRQVNPYKWTSDCSHCWDHTHIAVVYDPATEKERRAVFCLDCSARRWIDV